MSGRLRTDKFFDRNEVPRKVLMYLHNNYRKPKIYLTEMGRAMGLSVPYTYNLPTKLIRLGLITKTKEGRKVFIKLTEKGKAVAKKLKEIEDILQ